MGVPQSAVKVARSIDRVPNRAPLTAPRSVAVWFLRTHGYGAVYGRGMRGRGFRLLDRTAPFRLGKHGLPMPSYIKSFNQLSAVFHGETLWLMTGHWQI